MEYGLYNGTKLQYSFEDLIDMGVFKVKDGYILTGAYINVCEAAEEGTLTEADIEYIEENGLEDEDDFNRFSEELHGEIYLPPYIKEIGDSAFCALYHINKIVLPENLEAIRASAFASTGITEIVIPESVTIIERCAFFNCKLTELKLPDKLKLLGTQNFAPKNCKIKFKGIEFDSVNEMKHIATENLDDLLEKYKIRTINSVRNKQLEFDNTEK